MSLFYNEYQKICKENKMEAESLTRENYVVFHRMAKYISSYNISLFELEVIKKDLIGIAKEGEIENLSLEEKLGVEEKEFCDSLIKDAMEKSFLEHFLPVLQKIMFAVVFWDALLILVFRLPEEFFIGLGFWIYTGVLAFLVSVLDRMLGRGDYSKRKKRWNSVIGTLIVVLFLDPLGNMLPISILGTQNAIRDLIIFVILTILLFFANNYFWNQKAKKYM